jgi:hypothetical protein
MNVLVWTYLAVVLAYAIVDLWHGGARAPRIRYRD